MLSSLSSAFSSTFSANLRSEVGVAVARKTLDAAEAQGQAAVRMIEDAASVGQSVRASSRASGGLTITPRPTTSGNGLSGRGRISAQPGSRETGQRLDVTA